MYVEYALGSVSNRNHITPIKNLNSIREKAMNNDQELYRSLFLYDGALGEHLQRFQSVRSFSSTLYPDHLILDVDVPKRSDISLEGQVKRVHDSLLRLNVPKNSFQWFFSGRGFHCALHKGLFNWKPNPRLMHGYAQFCTENFGHLLDMSIYSANRLIRMNNTINTKSSLYKIPLTHEEIEDLNLEQVWILAVTPRIDLPINFHSKEILFETAQYEKQDTKDTFTGNYKPREIDGRIANVKINTCLHNMFNDGPKEGSRHLTMVTMASLMWRQGTPVKMALTAIEDWSRGQTGITQTEVERAVEDAYKRGYTPSCSGPNRLSKIMQEHCDSRCRFYANKDAALDVLAMDEIEATFKKDIQNEEYIFIDFARFLGLNHMDVKFSPGKLITIFGTPGSGKTAMAQNLLLTTSVSTLYLSMEMTETEMFRRFQQVNHNMSKDNVIDAYKENGGLSTDRLQHIKIITTSMNKEQIKDSLNSHPSKILIVDHLKLLKKDGKQNRAVLEDYTSFFKQLALKENILVIQVSQVGRIYGRGEQKLDLFAGLDSGSIEQDSDIVIGIDGKALAPQRKVMVFKNRDGDSPFQYLEQDSDTYRYTITEEPKIPTIQIFRSKENEDGSN